eukprot:Rmarinus@m.26129
MPAAALLASISFGSSSTPCLCRPRGDRLSSDRPTATCVMLRFGCKHDAGKLSASVHTRLSGTRRHSSAVRRCSRRVCGCDWLGCPSSGLSDEWCFFKRSGGVSLLQGHTRPRGVRHVRCRHSGGELLSAVHSWLSAMLQPSCRQQRDATRPSKPTPTPAVPPLCCRRLARGCASAGPISDCDRRLCACNRTCEGPSRADTTSLCGRAQLPSRRPGAVRRATGRTWRSGSLRPRCRRCEGGRCVWRRSIPYAKHVCACKLFGVHTLLAIDSYMPNPLL